MFYRLEINNLESIVEEGKGDGEKEKFLENWGYFIRIKVYLVKNNVLYEVMILWLSLFYD